MLVGVLCCHWLSTFLLASRLKKGDWREVWLMTQVLWGTQVVFATEMLSLFHAIHLVPVVAVWLVLSGTMLVAAGRGSQKRLLGMLQSVRRQTQGMNLGERVMLLFVGALSLALFMLAVGVPPNTWDAMTYHLARVVYWMQNASVEHYPTSIMRQHYQPPFAEYVLLHLQILTKGDHLSNAVQWLFYVNSFVAISLTTRLLGGNRFAQVLSIFLAATVPMAVLQATSTQNDLVCSFWIVAGVHYLIKTVKYPDKSHSYLLAACCVGLSILTKATAYILLFPFCAAAVAYIVIRLRKLSLGLLLAVCLVGGIGLFNTGHYWRNLKVYHHVLGATKQEREAPLNAVDDLPHIVSNIIRNTALHCRTPFYYWGRTLRLLVLKTHDLVGVDAYDSQITYYSSGNLPFWEAWNKFNEDVTGNLFHFLLILYCIISLCFIKNLNKKTVFVYIGLCGTAFLLFCTLLRWQEWHSRLHLPIFLLLAPACAIVLRQHKLLPKIIGVLLGGFAILCLIFNSNKPVFSKPENRFKSIWQQQRKDLYTPDYKNYQQSASAIADFQCDSLGLRLNVDDGDYLFWTFVRNTVPYPVVIQHVGVDNPSGQLEKKFGSNCILSTRDSSVYIVVNHVRYKREKIFGFVRFYSKQLRK